MAALVAHGLEVDLPAGWDGRIARRGTAPVEARTASTTAEATAAAGRGAHRHVLVAARGR